MIVDVTHAAQRSASGCWWALERGWRNRKPPKGGRFAGLRTFAASRLVAALGMTVAVLTRESRAGRLVAREARYPLRMQWPTRHLWLLAGWIALATGLIGVALPLLPTTPFLLLAAWCFSRGSPRIEQWLLNHPRLGPPVRDWRRHRAVPLAAKQFATAMMAVSSVWAGFMLPLAWCWVPGAVCTGAAIYLWRLPTRRPLPSD